MDRPDLLSLGEHCHEPSCRQRDFLPFKCDCCRKTFCLEHRTYSAHACDKAKGKTCTTIICPLCARIIKLEHGEDPNAAFEVHSSKDCNPENYEKVMKKPKCPVLGCRERLNLVNTHVCKHCSTRVCLKHRFPEEHGCKCIGKAGTTGKASLSQWLGLGATKDLLPKAGSQQSTRTPITGAAQRDPGIGPAQPGKPSILRAQSASQEPKQKLKDQNCEDNSCPICQKRFATASMLIAHAQSHEMNASYHQESCPHCRAQFANAVQLVEHVERQHHQQKGCVVC